MKTIFLNMYNVDLNTIQYINLSIIISTSIATYKSNYKRQQILSSRRLRRPPLTQSAVYANQTAAPLSPRVNCRKRRASCQSHRASCRSHRASCRRHHGSCSTCRPTRPPSILCRPPARRRLDQSSQVTKYL